jgi:2-oxoglutarate ferredoxin oxidoreductase subunit gamma
VINLLKQIRISGFGGQGVGLFGVILGRALALHQDYEVVMTQAYGPEARGGTSNANIVVADRPIDYPFVQKADVLVALSQESYARFRPETKADALLIIENDLVKPDLGDQSVGIPATRLAEGLGRRIVMNVVMLGFFAAVIDFTDHDAVYKAIANTVPPTTLMLNKKAFEIGYSHMPMWEKAA